jgi:hypothetical protein
MICLYKLSKEFYYVEKTDDPSDSFQRHIDGMGGPTTQLYRPIMIVEITKIDTKKEFDELITKYNIQYGYINLIIDNNILPI